MEINGNDVTTFDMKDSNGFRVDVSHVEVPRDMTVIRMNVDDFETAKEILEKHGFVNTNSGKKVESATSFSEFMVAPSGFAINLVKHVKEGE